MYNGLCEDSIDVNKLDKKQLIKKIKTYRKRWEKITNRDQESDVDLSVYSIGQLRESLKYFYSDECKLNAESWKQNEDKGIFNIFFNYFGNKKTKSVKTTKRQIKSIKKSKKKKKKKKKILAI